MESEVTRLRNLFAVQSEQLQSLRGTLRHRDEELLELKESCRNLEEKYESLQRLASSSKKQMEGCQESAYGLNDKLTRQGASIMELANKHIEGRQREVELLQFEVEKKDRIIISLRSELKKREEAVFLLRDELDDLQNWKNKVQSGKVASVVQHQADADARVALITAELHRSGAEYQAVTSRLTQLENIQKDKDVEIRAFREEINQFDDERRKMRNDTSSLQFELNMKDVQIAELQKTSLNREGDLVVALRRQQEKAEEMLQVERHKRECGTEQSKTNVESLQATIETIRQKMDSLRDSLQQARTDLEQTASEKAALQRQLGGAEALLEANDQSREIEILSQGEAALRQRLSEQLETIEAMQHDAAILKKTRVEKALKDKECATLKCQLEAVTSQLKEQRPTSMHERKIGKSQTGSTDFRTPLASALHGRGLSSPSASSLNISQLRHNRFPTTQAHEITMNSRESTLSRNLTKASPETGSGANTYLAKVGDPIDSALSMYIARNPRSITYGVKRVETGLYEFGDRRVYLRLINGTLMVQMDGGVISLAEFISNNRGTPDSQYVNQLAPPDTHPHIIQRYTTKPNTVDPFNDVIPSEPQGLGSFHNLI